MQHEGLEHAKVLREIEQPEGGLRRCQLYTPSEHVPSVGSRIE